MLKIQEKTKTISDKNMNLELTKIIQQSLNISTPAWPLQNTVAVNPFWFQKHQSCERVLENLSNRVGTSLLMPSSFYLERLNQGEIDQNSLSDALKQCRELWPDLPDNFGNLDQLSVLEASQNRPALKTFAEFFNKSNKDWAALVVADFGKYAAAYLDDKQATSSYPWQTETFWKSWLEAQQIDLAFNFSGAKGFHQEIKRLNDLDAIEAIDLMLDEMGIESPVMQQVYLETLITSVLGWSTQFKYIEWQDSLGYPIPRTAQTIDLVAVRLAYDYGLFRIASSLKSNGPFEWIQAFEREFKKLSTSHQSSVFRLKYALQLAWELSYQKRVNAQLSRIKSEQVSQPKAQMVFCIDVRSEMLRRHIEQVDPSIQTLGFAGFFGVPFDYQRSDENQVGHRLPVLLKPWLKVEEAQDSNHQTKHQEETLISSYFRNLRKSPLSSFAYVEIFGAFHGLKMLRQSWTSNSGKTDYSKRPNRFEDTRSGPSQALGVSQKDQVARAASILRHMGLTSNFAELVIFVGHGSETTNNAFGSALDCGACGGHAGDINARLLADLLNDNRIREGLIEEKIIIPSETRFMAAIHETVTDEIYPLDFGKCPLDFQQLFLKLQESLKKASNDTRAERQSARSQRLDINPNRRAKSWSEIRPEWGLAGNASFIVAPRERTLGVNLSSRSFLHDYDWRKDEKNSFQTLELIMTAPMVVTHWINFQYYASTVAPRVYGAGNKVIHNLVNETGVIEGNSGDLKFGLPIQSVHDGEKFIHDPLRLTVFIEAPREQIEAIIQKHATVRELVENEWLHLLQIDPSTLKTFRRLRSGNYTELKN